MDYDELTKFCDEREVKDATTARFIAQEWQAATSDTALSYGELAAWQGYFENLAEKFPELKEEFEENAII